MLRFGQYKGDTLMNIANRDLRYVCWMVNNINDIDYRLDYEDTHTLKKLTNPIDYINNKYPNLKSWPIDEALDTLKREGLVVRWHENLDPDGTKHRSFDTIYGSLVASNANVCNEILERLDSWSKEDFKQYLKKK